MKKEYRIRYKKSDNFYGFVTTYDKDLTLDQAKNDVTNFLKTNKIEYLYIDEMYYIDNEGNRILTWKKEEV